MNSKTPDKNVNTSKISRDMLTLASINLNKSHTAGGTLAKLMETMDIACLQEPPLNKKGMISGQKGLNNLAFGAKPRAGITWKGKFNIIPLPHMSDEDMATGLWTKPDNDKLIISSAYLDQTREINIDIMKLEKNTQICGDEGL